MNLLEKIQGCFAPVLAELCDDPTPYLGMIRSAQNPEHGDYQANFAMPLAPKLQQKPRDLAEQVISKIDVSEFCETPEVAGPGFINLRIKNDWLQQQLNQVRDDERLGVPLADSPKTYVIDYSGPNVAKPMHVGHLRSTVIGAALYHTLRFMGHTVIGDNHIGDWGTQFGMIIFGYNHFLNEDSYQESPVEELARLYRLINSIAGYQAAVIAVPKLEEQCAEKRQQIESTDTGSNEKAAKKVLKKLRRSLTDLQDTLAEKQAVITNAEQNSNIAQLAEAHPHIKEKARQETAKLHQGDEANQKLWHEFLPPCLAALDQMYDRLGISFEMTKGESDYHAMLEPVVDELKQKGIAEESDGAICVFLENHQAPFLIQKGDGAFTYATTDLATLKYRIEELKADAILYVVGSPQAEHFSLLFDTAEKWGYTETELVHVGFGSVLDQERRMYRTRSGDTVGLESLLDEAILRARKTVEENDDKKPGGRELSDEERADVAEVVGIGGVKFADLYHNRESDYVYDAQKMLEPRGDTGTYIQYAYARCGGIFRKGNTSGEELRNTAGNIQIPTPAERQLALKICSFEQALKDTLQEYRPNLLADFLLNLAKAFSTFFDQCPVLKEDVPDELRQSRLLMCELTARLIAQGLSLLGIESRERM